jgi:protein SYS1
MHRVIPILLFISRSKLVPDFALTIHFLHLLITSLYTGSLPTNLLWWALEGASAALMIVTGVWVCRYREMQPISFGAPPPKNVASSGENGSAEPLMGGNNTYEMGNVRGEENV